MSPCGQRAGSETKQTGGIDNASQKEPALTFGALEGEGRRSLEAPQVHCVGVVRSCKRQGRGGRSQSKYRAARRGNASSFLSWGKGNKRDATCLHLLSCPFFEKQITCEPNRRQICSRLPRTVRKMHYEEEFPRKGNHCGRLLSRSKREGDYPQHGHRCLKCEVPKHSLGTMCPTKKACQRGGS